MPGPKVIIVKSSDGPVRQVDYHGSRLFFADCHAFAGFLETILEREGPLDFLEFKMYMTEECWVLGWYGSWSQFHNIRIVDDFHYDFFEFGRSFAVPRTIVSTPCCGNFYNVLRGKLELTDDRIVVVSPIAKKSLKLADLFHTPDFQGRRLLYKFEKYENSGRLAVLQATDASLVEVANEWPSCTVFVCPAWFDDVARLFVSHKKCKFTPPTLEMHHQIIPQPPFDAFLDPLLADQLRFGKGWGSTKSAVSNFVIDRDGGGGTILRPISLGDSGAKSATNVALNEFLYLLPKSQIYTYEIAEEADGLCRVHVPRLDASFHFAQGVLTDVAISCPESYHFVNKLLLG